MDAFSENWQYNSEPTEQETGVRMIELTLATGLALVLGLIGVTFFINGLRGGFIDEVLIAALCFIGVWWLL